MHTNRKVKKNVTIPNTRWQLQHSQSNESTLRGQLREAKSAMEEQNRKFTQLEDKVHGYDVTIETKTTKIKDLTADLQAIKVCQCRIW